MAILLFYLKKKNTSVKILELGLLGGEGEGDVAVSVPSPRKEHLLTDAERQAASSRCILIS